MRRWQPRWWCRRCCRARSCGSRSCCTSWRRRRRTRTGASHGSQLACLCRSLGGWGQGRPLLCTCFACCACSHTRPHRRRSCRGVPCCSCPCFSPTGSPTLTVLSSPPLPQSCRTTGPAPWVSWRAARWPRGRTARCSGSRQPCQQHGSRRWMQWCKVMWTGGPMTATGWARGGSGCMCGMTGGGRLSAMRWCCTLAPSPGSMRPHARRRALSRCGPQRVSCRRRKSPTRGRRQSGRWWRRQRACQGGGTQRGRSSTRCWGPGRR